MDYNKTPDFFLSETQDRANAFFFSMCLNIPQNVQKELPVIVLPPKGNVSGKIQVQ